MTLLARYVAQRTATPFFGMLGIILLSLVLERLLRLIEEVTAYSAPLDETLKLLLRLLPHYLGLAIPAALFIAVILGVRALLENSELIVMQAVGRSFRALWTPVLILSLGMSLILLLLVGHVQPYGRYMYRVKLQELKTAPLQIQARSGVFQSFGENGVLRADRADAENGILLGVFAFIRKADGQKQIITAREGVIERVGPGALTLRLNDGQLITKKPGESPSIVDFEQYPWRPELRADTYGPRGQDERELTLPELLHGMQNAADAEIKAAHRAEFHARLTMVFSLPLLCLLAVNLALVGRGRTARASGLILGIIFLIGYEKALGFGGSFTAAGIVSPWIGLWLPVALLAAGSLFWLRQRGQEM